MPQTTSTNKIVIVISLYLGFFVFHIVSASLFRELSAINPLKYQFHNALWSEPLMMLMVFWVLKICSARMTFSFLLTCLFYLLLMFVNIEKASALQIPVFPADIFYFFELFYNEEALSDLWLVILALAVTVIAVIIVLVTTKPNESLRRKRRLQFPLMLLVVAAFAFFRNDISHWITSQNYRLVYSAMITEAEKNGFMTIFFKRMIDYKSAATPDGYSKQKISNIITKYGKAFKTRTTAENKPNVIILLVEAFTDPIDVGFQTTYDPLPNLRNIEHNHISGDVMVPVVGGLSANSEFELLTGLSMRFIPEGSIPYIDTIDQDMPSIAREFKAAGYFTEALHVATLSFFNYELVYPFLAFDKHSTLHLKKGVTMDPANRYPNEESLVKEIITRTEKHRPQFIFSFPNSTHGFWDYNAYLNSELEILNWPSDILKDDMKTYVNALHQADAAIGKLIDHYSQFEEDTVVLIAGDHMPSLFPYRFQKLIHQSKHQLDDPQTHQNRKLMHQVSHAIKQEQPEEFYRILHQVPFYIWANFELPQLQENTSMNLLHDYLFDLINHSPSPLYQLTKQLKKEVKEVSQVFRDQDGSYTFEVPAAHQTIVDDYQILQYDILYGHNYYTQWLLTQDRYK